MMTLYDIQHIQIETTADGLLILINGQMVPSIAWDGEKLVATADALKTFGASVALLDKVLPLVQHLGIGVTLRFPVAQGAEAYSDRRDRTRRGCRSDGCPAGLPGFRRHAADHSGHRSTMRRTARGPWPISRGRIWNNSPR